MTEIYINYLAVILAAIANMALGFIWYGPLFGKAWMSLSHMSKEKMESQKTKASMWRGYLFAFVGSLLMAYVLSRFLAFSVFYTDIVGLNAGISVGFWSWLGFIAPVTLGVILWEGKSWKLWVLNNSYYLISVLIMASILALWS